MPKNKKRLHLSPMFFVSF